MYKLCGNGQQYLQRSESQFSNGKALAYEEETISWHDRQGLLCCAVA